MRTLLIKLIKNWKKIVEGVLRAQFPSSYVEVIAKRRAAICESNVCGYYDPEGIDDACILPGKACCTGCGCNKNWKVHSLRSYCYLKDIGQTPLWDSEMTQKEEDSYRKKHKIED